MKKLLLILVFNISAVNIFSQDTTSVEYLQKEIQLLEERLNEKYYPRVPNADFEEPALIFSSWMLYLKSR